MSENSLILKLPYIQPSQAQKHITHNEAINRLDYLVQMSALTRSLSTPPEVANEGDRYIVGPNAEAIWTGQENALAVFQDTVWEFISPKIGWQCYLQDEAAMIVFDGSSWVPSAATSLDQLGISADTDDALRFAAQTNRALWTAAPEDDGGSGDFLQIMNKISADKDLGFALQTNFKTHALLGTFGNETLTLKTSQDGTTFKEALSVDNVTGEVSHPQLPRFKAVVNYNQWIDRTNWAKVAINDTHYNDQLCFDPVTNLFTAPSAGTYVLGAHAIYVYANSNSSRLRIRLVQNESLAIPGTTIEVSSGHLSTKTGVNVTTLVQLDQGDTVSLQAHYRNAAAYVMANETCFWGYKVG